jgi:hypothetical protein
MSEAKNILEMKLNPAVAEVGEVFAILRLVSASSDPSPHEISGSYINVIEIEE